MHFSDPKSILSSKNGINIYRGCTHGCIYCDSRSLCYGMNHDFEDIEVKRNAPQLLYNALIKKRKKCMIGTGAMCDPYIHLENELGYTRQCLEVIDELGFGVSILTKSIRILRDLDILKSINNKSKCVVQMTLTTYDENLCKMLEPNVSTTYERFKALKVFRDNGIPTVVWLTPILPFINDTEKNLCGILNYCIKAEVYGIICFGFGTTAREGSCEFFYKNIDALFPGRNLRERYISTYGNAYEITSPNNMQLMKIFKTVCRDHNIITDNDKIFEYLQTYEDKTMQQIKF